MNVQGISTGQTAAAWSTASPIAGGHHDGHYQAAMGSVADLLGESLTQLATDTRTQSLAQLAAAKGIDPSALQAAIKSGLQQAGSQLSGTRLDNIAERIANMPPHRHRVHASAGGIPPAPSTGSATGSSSTSLTPLLSSTADGGASFGSGSTWSALA
jgi:hypothetical protein